jgi:hypothetical protein
MQAAQQGPALPASLPGALPNAPTAGTPGAVSPAQTAAASPVSQGTGALPGAVIAGLPRPGRTRHLRW